MGRSQALANDRCPASYEAAKLRRDRTGLTGRLRCIAVISPQLAASPKAARKNTARAMPWRTPNLSRWMMGRKKAPGFPKPGALIPTSFIKPA